MAQHKVEFELPTRELGNSNLEFGVWRDGDHLGTLRVSKGAVVWTHTKNKLSYKLDWKKFADLMVANGRRGRHT
jgi:hypothetical protein